MIDDQLELDVYDELDLADDEPDRLPTLPVGPVAELLRARMLEYRWLADAQETTTGYAELARRIADRSGLSYARVSRLVDRIIGSHVTQLYFRTADLLCSALDRHVDDVYGREARWGSAE